MVNQTLWYAIMYEPYQGEEYFENETFAVRPYSWAGDVVDDVQDYIDYALKEGTITEDDIEKVVHDNSWHFWHKPSGLKVSWYKYPLRSPESNMDIDNVQFYAVLQDCMNSVPERCEGIVKLTDQTFNKLWEK